MQEAIYCLVDNKKLDNKFNNIDMNLDDVTFQKTFHNVPDFFAEYLL